MAIAALTASVIQHSDSFNNQITKVLTLRLKGKVDGVDFNFKNLYYLSVNISAPESTSKYGRRRLIMEATEAWLNKQLVYAGIAFNDSEASLADAEIAKIPGSEILKSLDAVKFEVCVRNGSAIEIHPDETKFWLGQEEGVADEFKVLKAHHDEHYKNKLCGIIQSKTTPADKSADTANDTATGDDDEPLAKAALDKMQEFESVAALEEIDGPFAFRTTSEECDVELIQGGEMREGSGFWCGQPVD